MREKTILVDCDGVLLDWVYSFSQWMNRHGYTKVCDDSYDISMRYGIEKTESKKLVRMFNESATIRKLPPHLDAIKYVRKLHEEHGFIFHAITSLSNDCYAQHLRTKNLIELFGPTAFEKYIYLDTGADKDEVLSEYEGTNCVWVEDKPENADVGLEFGLDSLLMAHSHNKNYKGHAKRVNNWKEIYEFIVG
jgi:FMN phosphatase YigB (HAD superfamily)